MEKALEASPLWLKSFYVHLMKGIKHVLSAMGLLKKLDNLACQSQRFHYLRSLLAIHQLEDMIQLDIPWWTYDAISEIDAHIQQLGYAASVFEYGSGASTLWLAKRKCKVFSIEHDSAWFYRLQQKLNNYPEVVLQLAEPVPSKTIDAYHSQKQPHVSFKNYVQTIDSDTTQYDLIIIDGRAREMCLEKALHHLKDNGLIIFDNSNRKRYQAALKASGYEIKRFYGRVPGSPFKSETAILRKRV